MTCTSSKAGGEIWGGFADIYNYLFVNTFEELQMMVYIQILLFFAIDLLLL